MQSKIDFKRLQEPVPATDIEWRIQQSGKSKSGKLYALVFAYVTNRAIMQRFDDVVGPANWRNEYSAAPDGGILCGIGIRCGDEWVTKYDGAANTQVEAVKGGLSGAMKRAAVQWGIGRYLYGLDATFATISDAGIHRAKLSRDNGGDVFRWSPPDLPAWALPPAEKPKDKPKAQPKKDPIVYPEGTSENAPTAEHPWTSHDATQKRKLEGMITKAGLDREYVRDWLASRLDGERISLNDVPVELSELLTANEGERLQQAGMIEQTIKQHGADRDRALAWVVKVSKGQCKHFLDLDETLASKLIDKIVATKEETTA